MNLRRGFFRIWVVVTVVWTLLVGTLSWESVRPPRESLRDDPIISGPVDFADLIPAENRTAEQQAAINRARERRAAKDAAELSARRLTVGGIIIIPPLIVLAFGAAIGWALTGFRQT